MESSGYFFSVGAQTETKKKVGEATFLTKMGRQEKEGRREGEGVRDQHGRIWQAGDKFSRSIRITDYGDGVSGKNERKKARPTQLTQSRVEPSLAISATRDNHIAARGWLADSPGVRASPRGMACCHWPGKQRGWIGDDALLHRPKFSTRGDCCGLWPLARLARCQSL